MSANCTAFAQNAWKKELCSNCFRSESEHRGVNAQENGQGGGTPSSGPPPPDQHSVGVAESTAATAQAGQLGPANASSSAAIVENDNNSIIKSGDYESNGGDGASLNRLHEAMDSLDVSNRNANKTVEEIHVVANTNILMPNGTSNSGSGHSSLSSAVGSNSSSNQHNVDEVIERLDSLVSGGSSPPASLDVDSQKLEAEGKHGKNGILKDVNKERSSSNGDGKKRSISFPDYEELQEIIGYGGEDYYSSEGEDADVKEADSGKSDDYYDEITPEERNVINLTKKNTTFNAHAQNLKEAAAAEAPKLGLEKKHTPIVSVRPFVREHLPGKVHMVSPMINGELVFMNGGKDDNKQAASSSASLLSRKFGKEEVGGRGEVRTKAGNSLKKDNLGSDGSYENSSDSDSSNLRDSPPPHDLRIAAASGFSLGFFEEDEEKTGSGGTNSTSDSSHDKNEAIADDLSVRRQEQATVEASVQSCVNNGETRQTCLQGGGQQKEEGVGEVEKTKKEIPPVDPELSLLSNQGLSLCEGKTKTEPPLANSSSENERQTQVNKNDVSDSDVVHCKKTTTNDKISRNSENKDNNTIHPRVVKLTRKSPYVIGGATPSAILKGTPKPMITRKPPILKDKPKIPLKPNKLMMRSPSSSPSPPPPQGGTRSINNNRSSLVTPEASSDRMSSVPSSPEVKTTTEESVKKKRSASALVRKSPVAAPRTSSFRNQRNDSSLSLAPANDLADGSFDTTVVSAAHPFSQSTNSSVQNVNSQQPGASHSLGQKQNSLIISVSGSSKNEKTPDVIVSTAGSTEKYPQCTVVNANSAEKSAKDDNVSKVSSPPIVQKSLALKNKEALEAIRKSLSNKLINPQPPPCVIESIKASNGGSIDLPVSSKKPVEKTISSTSFEETRAALEDALHFGKHDINGKLNNGKRQAPLPPPDNSTIIANSSDQNATEKEDNQQEAKKTEETIPTNENNNSGSIIRTELEQDGETSNDLSRSSVKTVGPSTTAGPQTVVPATPKLTPAIRNSSMKNGETANGKPKDSKPRSVQFSPDTLTVKLPSNNNNGGSDRHKMISYNRWMSHKMSAAGHNPYLESSFTGQPIPMLPPGVISAHHMKKAPPVIAYTAGPVIDDAPRKWTEKKTKWRSKSTPRSSDIDEIIGSSKTKAPNRLAIFAAGMTTSSPAPAKRQSRAEIYESEKRLLHHKNASKGNGGGKFSLMKFFRPNGLSSAGSDGHLSIVAGHLPSVNQVKASMAQQQHHQHHNKFVDKEHERELIERHHYLRNGRPEIIHPLDLQSGAVEVVKITPKNRSVADYEQSFDKRKPTTSSVLNLSAVGNSLVGSPSTGERPVAAMDRRMTLSVGDLRPASMSSPTSNSQDKMLFSVHRMTAQIDYDGGSRDSGHDTSSIQTEASEEAASTSSSTSSGVGGGGTESGVGTSSASRIENQSNGDNSLDETHKIITGSTLGVNSAGKPKPLPPPRSQSLDTFSSSNGVNGHEETDDEIDHNHMSALVHHLSPYHEESRTGLLSADRLSASVGHLDFDTASSPTFLPPPQYITAGKMTIGHDMTVPNPTGLLTTATGGLHQHSPVSTSSSTSSPVIIPSPATISHVKSGSINSDSDSTPSYPSSSASYTKSGGSSSDCSAALAVKFGSSDEDAGESERDSVSPQRIVDEVVYLDNDSPLASANRKRLVSMKRGRSIVHKNLEDNYGAVISANHEALAQILDQVCQNRPIPTSLRPLAAAINLRFNDFSVLSESEGLRTARRAFYPATWGTAHLPVTLMVSRDMRLNSAAGRATNSFSLTAIAQFVDMVPNYLLSPPAATKLTGANDATGGSQVGGRNMGGLSSDQGVVWALSRLSILPFSSYSRLLKQRRKSLVHLDDYEKDISFVMLQLINGLKFLQAQGIEETRAELDNFLLARQVDNSEHGDANYRLIITEECYYSAAGGGQFSDDNNNSNNKMSLCQCALAAMLQLFDIADPVKRAREEPPPPIELPQVLPSVSMFRTMAVILQKGGAVSLGQVKSMLEYMLWGPSDIIFDAGPMMAADASALGGQRAESREESLQRWLDLERATVLHNMIRGQGALWGLGGGSMGGMATGHADSNRSLTVSVWEEYHLLFLVRTCAKMLGEASLLFESEVSRM